MKCIHIIVILVGIPLLAAATDLAPISRVLGLTTVGTSSGLAVWVPLAENEALAGIMWYNNDGTIAFPSFLVGCGHESEPGMLDEMTIVAINAQGASVQWSEQSFSESIASSVDGIYMVIRFPVGSEQVEAGAGGGAGVGYTVAPGGLRAWMSWDSQVWMRMHDSLKLAIVPIIEDAGPGTLRLDRASKGLSVNEETPQMVLITTLHAPTPNPFNPQTELSFTLARAGNIDLTIHDLRGAMVKRLATGLFSAGPHELIWTGRDGADRRVASGVYVARLMTATGVLSRQMVLLK